MKSTDSDNVPECSHGPIPITSKNNTEVPGKDNLREIVRPAYNANTDLSTIDAKETPETENARRDNTNTTTANPSPLDQEKDNLRDIVRTTHNANCNLHTLLSTREIYENTRKDNTNAMTGIPSPSVQSMEITTHLFCGNPDQMSSASQSNVTKILSPNVRNQEKPFVPNSMLPFLLNCRNSSNKVITSQPLGNQNQPSTSMSSTQPPSLFIQALSKVNENSLGLSAEAFMNRLGHLLGQHLDGGSMKSDDLRAPDSLTSAPPSYSFVLRQSSARSRRPRLMGTFIPSPSFITHTPPPNYATAFDIYVDNAPPPPVQVYNYGFTPMHVICPECGFAGMTVVDSRITLCTHLCAVILCLFCCWICVPLPYIMRSCKDVYHYCQQCSNYLGMYCPTNPENAQRQHYEVNRRRNVSPRTL